MRKIFTLLTAFLTILCLWHAAMGSFMLLGISTRPAAFMGCLVGILAVCHILLGCRFWLRTLRQGQCFYYSHANRLFWLRRGSGVAVVLLFLFHWHVFGSMEDTHYMLYEFTTFKLITQFLFVSMLFLHIGLNIRPLLLALGMPHIAVHTRDLYSVLFILYLFMIGSLLYYYAGWQYV